jgi:putative tricarboxylic transport membrane protein
MKSDLLGNKDFLAGIVFVLIGLLAVAVARDYPFGIAMRMGPGYFPTVLGGILILLGAWVIARGLRLADRVKGEWGWKPLAFIALAFVVFGLLMPRVGLLPALAAAILASAFGGREFRVKEALVLAVVMSALTAALLIVVLKMPYPLIAGVMWIS